MLSQEVICRNLLGSRTMKKIFFLGIITTVVAVLGIGLTSSTASAGQVLQVGAGKPYKTPSAAAKVAKNGDVVEIDASTYWGDVAVWSQDNITLRGVGGRAHLKARGKTAQGKAIWVIKGNNITVENMEFSGARVADKNGAGIRFEGAGLTIRNSHFHHNEIGILVNGNLASDILIEGSEFHHNTLANQHYSPPGHNIYVGKVRRFTLRNSYVHHASVGHNVKSYAQENYILYNRIMDEELGNSSYLLDLAEGGDAYVIGNVFQQSQYTDNYTMVSYAAEANRNDASQYLYFVNNTLVNDAGKGTFVNNHSVAPATLLNNLWVGNGKILQGFGDELAGNIITQNAGFVNPAGYDYRLMQGSVAIDQGVEPGYAHNGFSLQPLFHYVHPLEVTTRPLENECDVGAYEFTFNRW